jgi:hypothetical protein
MKDLVLILYSILWAILSIVNCNGSEKKEKEDNYQISSDVFLG